MHGRIRDLSPASVTAVLPEPCRRCVFWESAEGGLHLRPLDLPDGASRKEAWWQATQLEWGTPGKAVYDGDELIAYALFAPGPHFPRSRTLQPVPSEDALLLATLWVDPQHRKAGLARALVQSVMREVHRRGARALEAYGIADPPPESRCLVPASFLEAAGFALHRADRRTPLYRLDLRATARWQESMGHALEGALAVLGRRERRVPARSPGAAAQP